MTTRGLFFVIDGGDGSGKATQTKLLIERLRSEGHQVETIAFPQYKTASAGPLEKYLAGGYGSPEDVGSRRASILYAIDRYDASAKIEGWLAEGKLVIADRYVASNMGHQGSKIANKGERMAFYAWNDDLEFGIFRIPRPDLNIILHVDAETSVRLIAKRGEKTDAHENLAHLQAAERTYIEIANSFPGFRMVECVANGDILPVETIHGLIWDVVHPLLAGASGRLNKT
jgi:dTMP kinase